jgi:hypothetical protein
MARRGEHAWQQVDAGGKKLAGFAAAERHEETGRWYAVQAGLRERVGDISLEQDARHDNLEDEAQSDATAFLGGERVM